MRSVRDQNVRKIAIVDGSTQHIAVTTPCVWNQKRDKTLKERDLWSKSGTLLKII